MIYEVTAELDGRFWLVRVPAIDDVTQAQTVREIDEMAKDLIRIMTDETDPEIAITIVLPDDVRKS